MSDDGISQLGTPTPVLGLIKPTVGGDVDIWGDMLNANFDVLDADVPVTVSSTPPASPYIGKFWWNASITNLYLWLGSWVQVSGLADVPNDGTAYVRQYGVWQHITYAMLPSEIQSVPIAFPIGGKPAASAQINVPIMMTLTLPTTTGFATYATTAATANANFMLNKISGGVTTAMGPIQFLAGSHGGTGTITAGVTLAVGDCLQLVSPSTQDATLSDLGITILAQRV